MDFDLLVRQATIYPGDGPPFRGDVGVARDRIAAVEPSLAEATASEVIEGNGLVLSPGFIDLHAHSALRSFEGPLLEPKVGQGFTTELINLDGLAPAPVAPARQEARRAYLQPLEGPGPERWTWSSVDSYLEALDATAPVTTLVPSVGHNAVREFILGSGDRQPESRELESMREEVRLGFEAGARALSFGLIYLPGIYSRTEELVAVAQEAARFGAPLVPHVRNEAASVLQAVGEMVEVARRSGAPLHISHLKVIGNPALVEPLLELLDRARQDIDLSFDQYPYGAGSTMLSALLPGWAQAGGGTEVVARLRDPAARRRIHDDVANGLPGWENLFKACGAENIVIVHAAGEAARFVGRSLADIGDELSRQPLDAALDLLCEANLDVAMVDHYASEEVTRAIFRHPLALVGSDGIFGPHPHPRLYGTAARVLGRYAIRERLIPVEDAVARLTSRAADRLQLADRGRVCVGLRADLVLLDPDRYVDTATYDNPVRFAEGVELVVAGGEVVWRHDRPTGARPGGVLRTALARA